MNYIYLLIEIVLVFLLMIIFYKIDKKDSLYVYIGLMGTILGVSINGSIDILSFSVNMGIPIVMGLFICNNVIIHRYGLDEVKRILCTFGGCYLLTIICIGFVSFINDNSLFDLLFGYNLNSLRVIIGGFISMIIMLWMSSGIYYSIRKNRSAIVISNLISAFVVAFIESMIFVLVAYTGYFDFIELFGMISVRYIIEVIIGIIGLIPVYYLIKNSDK